MKHQSKTALSLMNDPDNDGGALSRALTILRLITAADAPLSNRELSDMTGVSKATVSRITSQLIAARLLRREVGGDRFRVGTAALDMGRAFLERLSVRSEMETHMRNFTEQTGTTVHLGVHENLDVIITEKIQPRSAMLVTRLNIGSKVSLLTSSMGRAYIAGMNSKELSDILELLNHTQDHESLENATIIHQARNEMAEHGYCTSFGDCVAGVNAIGTFIRWPDNEIYLINCGGPAYQFPASMVTGPVAARFAQAISALCSATGATSPISSSHNFNPDSIRNTAPEDNPFPNQMAPHLN